MVTIPLDKINYNKVSKYANVLIFKEFYPKTKNVSYYLNVTCNDISVIYVTVHTVDVQADWRRRLTYGLPTP